MPTNPNVTAFVPGPTALDPDRVRPWPNHITAAHPNPTADAPGPSTWRPDVFRAWGCGHNLDLRRRRGLLDHDWSSRSRWLCWHIDNSTFNTAGSQRGDTTDCNYQNSVFFHKFSTFSLAMIDVHASEKS